jgi:hypothetical protein
LGACLGGGPGETPPRTVRRSSQTRLEVLPPITDRDPGDENGER